MEQTIKTLLDRTKNQIKNKYITSFPGLCQCDDSTGLLTSRYIIESCFIETNYGFVMFAHDQKTQQDVCIKVSLRYLVENGLSYDFQHTREDLKTEAKVLQQLNGHPHIVTCIEFREDDVYQYLVTEKINGIDLNSLITIFETHSKQSVTKDLLITSRDTKITLLYDKFVKKCLGYEPSQEHVIIQYMFQQLVHTLYFLHCQGISHNDVALENVMVDLDFNITLIDFGVCITKQNLEIAPLRFLTRFLPKPTMETDEKHVHQILSVKWDDELRDFVSLISNDGVLFGHLSTVSPEMWWVSDENRIIDLFANDRYALGVTLYIMTKRENIFDEHPEDEDHLSILHTDWSKDSEWKEHNMWKRGEDDDFPLDAMEVVNGLVKYENQRWDWDTLLHHPYVTQMIKPEDVPRPTILQPITRSYAKYFIEGALTVFGSSDTL